MHPILHLAPQRHAEYRRGLAHGLALAIDQLRQLASSHPLLTSSSVSALARRLQAISDTVRREAWTEANQLIRHEIAPPLPTHERPVHRPVMGRAAEENTMTASPASPLHHIRSTSRDDHDPHLLRRSRLR